MAATGQRDLQEWFLDVLEPHMMYKSPAMIKFKSTTLFSIDVTLKICILLYGLIFAMFYSRGWAVAVILPISHNLPQRQFSNSVFSSVVSCGHGQRQFSYFGPISETTDRDRRQFVNV